MSLGVHNESIQEQIDQLFSSILLEQQKINAVKPPQAEKSATLKEYLEDYAKYRGRPILYNYGSTGRGHGPFVELKDGSVKYDLINGIGFNILGHSHPIFIKSCLEAATSDTMMIGNLQPSDEPYELSKTIMEYAAPKSKLKYFWFAGSGSFAGDIALKIIWQKNHPRERVIALDKAFAGRSVAMQEVTANEAYRIGQPKLMKVDHVPGWDINEPEKSAEKTLQALDQLWEKHGDNFAGMVVELIQGEGGFIFGTSEYYRKIFSWAKEKGIYVWADEVQTFCRTREMFAFQMFGLEDLVDIVTVAKALQGAGVIYTEELNPQPGLIAGTFNGSVPAIKAGNKLLKYLKEGNFYGEGGRIHQIEEKFINGLKNLANGSCKGKIGYAGGVGTMIAFEVGDSSKDQTLDFCKALFENGIISFIAGKEPTRVRFLLPVCLTDEHIDEVMSIIEKTALEFFK